MWYIIGYWIQKKLCKEHNWNNLANLKCKLYSRYIAWQFSTILLTLHFHECMIFLKYTSYIPLITFLFLAGELVWLTSSLLKTRHFTLNLSKSQVYTFLFSNISNWLYFISSNLTQLMSLLYETQCFSYMPLKEIT